MHNFGKTKYLSFRYLDVKYEYLSYCLKLKEMDDEEMEYHSLNEGLYRVETGNYEYRWAEQESLEPNNKHVERTLEQRFKYNPVVKTSITLMVY